MAKTKQKKKPPQTTGGQDDTGHLETTLEDLTSTTAATFKKYSKPVVAVVVAVLIIALAIGATRAVQENQHDTVQARFYRLFSEPVANNASPDEAGLLAFFAEIRGEVAEVFMVKEWVSYQMKQATELEKPSEASLSGGLNLTDITAPPEVTGDPQKANQLRQKALTLAAELAARHSGNPNLQTWKDAVQKKVEAAANSSWLPVAPSYELPKIDTK